MKKVVLFVSIVALALVAVPSQDALAGPVVDPAYRGRPHTECPEDSGRVVTFSCIPGAAGGVAGVYGGAGFGLLCNATQGASSSRLLICTEPGDTSWAISGAASLRDGKQVRFGTSGNDRVVHYRVGNGEVRLNILP